MGLTDREIRTARPSKGLRQTELRDDQVRGLILRAYKSGAKSWFVFYRRKEDNRRRYLKLGAYPGLSLKDARDLAEIELGRIAAGEDPQAERVAARERSGAETMSALAELYLKRYAKVHKRPKGYAVDRWQLETYVLPRWGKRPIDEITKRDVRDLLQELADGKIAAKGKPTNVAPRSLRACLSKMFDWAADEGLLPGNPAAGVKLPPRVREHLKKGGRDRVLSDEEIGVLWEHLQKLEEIEVNQGGAPTSSSAIRMLLLTAQRPGEVLRMRWSLIEDGRWWVIPAEVAKNGEANRVPLSPQAQEILDRLRPYTGESDWVFESQLKPGCHQTTITAAARGIVKRAKMRHWTPHDLRRTAASKMRAMGVTRRVVQSILNHKDGSITAVYDRYGMDPEKETALTDWGRRVEEIVGGGSPGAVVPFPGNRLRDEATTMRSSL